MAETIRKEDAMRVVRHQVSKLRKELYLWKERALTSRGMIDRQRRTLAARDEKIKNQQLQIVRLMDKVERQTEQLVIFQEKLQEYKRANWRPKPSERPSLQQAMQEILEDET